MRLLTKFRIRWFVGFEADLKQETPLGNDLGHYYRQIFENSFKSTPEFEIVSWSQKHVQQVPEAKGTAQRNEAIERIPEPDEWIAFVDDDTHLPPDYEATILKAIQENPNADGFVFEQLKNIGGLRMSVSSDQHKSFVYDVPGYVLGTLGCDTGQMLFKRKLIGNVRWKHQGAADHIFCDDVALNEKNKPRVKWLNVPASIHNALRK